MPLGDRLRALDERHVWSAARPAAPRPTRTAALGFGGVVGCVYVGWSLAWGWPRAALAVLVLGVLLGAAGRFWFAAPAASAVAGHPTAAGHPAADADHAVMGRRDAVRPPGQPLGDAIPE